MTASGASRTTNAVNPSTIRDADLANARSQPRTVVSGRPNHAPILRCPHPKTTFLSTEAAITSAASARRDASRTSNNTCVTRHPEQRARRGRYARTTRGSSVS